MIRSIYIGIITFILVTQTGCPGTGSPSSKKCLKVGQQCKRGGGELGVCTPTQALQFSSKESLECVAQH